MLHQLIFMYLFWGLNAVANGQWPFIKVSIITITPFDSARNLGVIFDASLPMLDHISSVSKSCFMAIRDLRCIRNTLDSTTAKTIATSQIHSKVDYCNSLFLNLTRCQLDRLQLILNSAARALSKTPRFTHISPVLKSLHWLNAFTTKFSHTHTKHSNLASPPICTITIFCKFNPTLALVLLPLSIINTPQFPLDSK